MADDEDDDGAFVYDLYVADEEGGEGEGSAAFPITLVADEALLLWEGGSGDGSDAAAAADDDDSNAEDYYGADYPEDEDGEEEEEEGEGGSGSGGSASTSASSEGGWGGGGDSRRSVGRPARSIACEEYDLTVEEGDEVFDPRAGMRAESAAWQAEADGESE